MKNLKKENGITLVVLVVTIIILLILAGITINSLMGSGLFEKTQLAKNETEDAQIDEDKKVKEYDDEINQYISNGREQVTVDKEEYEKLKKDVNELKNKNAVSTDEKVIGTWMNEETIYSKTIYIESLPSSSTAGVYEHGIDNIKMVWVDNKNSFVMINGNINITVPFPWVNTNNLANIAAITQVDNKNIVIKTDSNRSKNSAYITLNYTKK